MARLGAEGRNQGRRVEEAETCGLWHEEPLYSGMKTVMCRRKLHVLQTTGPDTVSYRLPVPVSFATYSYWAYPGDTFSVSVAALRLPVTGVKPVSRNIDRPTPLSPVHSSLKTACGLIWASRRN